MSTHLPRLLIIALLLTAWTVPQPALAGGWATVRLDESPTQRQIVAGESVSLGFVVLQHDIRPAPGIEALLTATHKVSQEEIQAEAEAQGPVGHYRVAVVFPEPGEWKWGITPAPFELTSFETLTVLPAGSAPASASKPGRVERLGAARQTRAAVIAPGTCPAPETETTDALPLNPLMVDETVRTEEILGDPEVTLVQTSVTEVRTSLADLLTANQAIAIRASEDPTDLLIACGTLGGIPRDGTLAITLTERYRSGFAGLAWLTEHGDTTTVTLFVAPNPDDPTPTTDPFNAPINSSVTSSTEIAIVNASFFPARLEIPVGTAVTWHNADTMAHTVTGTDLAFNDSAVLATGDSFTQTFSTPGTYTYRCGPHPGMTGTIIVT